MSRFQWEAVDAQGHVMRGTREADNARALRQTLQSEGLTPTAVDEAADAAATLSWTRLPPQQVSLLTRQLATLVYSGLPLHQALQAVTEQTDDKRVRAIVTALAQHVAGGESFSAALAHYPRTFSPLYRGLVAAGVESGLLPEVLQRLADYLDARLALKQKFVMALIYPVLVMVIALAVVGFVSGLAIAPTFTNANTLVRTLVPSHRLTEGLAWIGTSIGLGASVGSSVAGRLIDDFGYQAGFMTAAALAVAATLTAFAGFRALSRRLPV